MSKFHPPAAGKSGGFIISGAVAETTRYTNWDDNIVVPAGYSGAIVHAQFGIGLQLPADNGRGIVGRVKANGVEISRLATAAGNNNGGDAVIVATCTGLLSAPGTYAMTILLQIVNETGTSPLNRDVLATGDPDGPPTFGNTMVFEFSHYFVQLF
jgi:hypothetical protein